MNAIFTGIEPFEKNWAPITHSIQLNKTLITSFTVDKISRNLLYLPFHDTLVRLVSEREYDNHTVILLCLIYIYKVPI